MGTISVRAGYCMALFVVRHKYCQHTYLPDTLAPNARAFMTLTCLGQ